MADRLSFKIFLTSLFVLLTTGLTHAQNPTDSVLLERVLDYRSNFQQQNDGQQQNAYMKYTFRTERRNVMLNLVPTMYTLAKGERLRVGESYCRLTCSNPQHIDFRRQVSAGNIAHYKKAMPTVLELVIPFIYEECLFDVPDNWEHNRVLNIPADSLLRLTERAVRSHNPRPLMQGLSRDELHRKIKQQLKERESTYLRAHIILDGTCPQL